jgi:metallo-beta-lactamase class B
MPSITKAITALAAILCLCGAAAAPDSIDYHMAVAKQAAGMDFKGTLGALCLPSLPPAPPAGIPDRASWYAAPYKVFDDLYFIGTRDRSSWALKTSGGLIVIDTLFNYAAKAEIVDGLTRLGLDPATIKYVILSHGHNDHDQGARLLQDLYGAHVILSPQDWDAIANGPDMPGGKPRRDMLAQDGQKLVLGDTVVTLIATPGHTPGTFSLLFPVHDHGRPLMVAYAGGTLTGKFGANAALYDMFIASQHKMGIAAARAGATIVMSNHSEFDGAYTKVRLLAGRQPGEAHPYEVGADGVQRYFKVLEECATAAKLRAIAR